MTALLYMSSSSGLSEDEKLLIDREVSRNREKVVIIVKTFASNTKNETKRMIVGISLAGVFYFSTVRPSQAMGLSMRPAPAPVVIAQPNCEDAHEIKVASTVNRKLDKMPFRQLPVYIYTMDRRFLETPEINKLLNKIRGGGFFDAAGALILLTLMWKLSGGDPFGLQNPGWGLPRPGLNQPPGGRHIYPPVHNLFWSGKTKIDSPRPSTALAITRPASMPHDEFVALTKEQRRALPHSKDMKIIHEGRPELEVGFWQSKFKVGDHGAIHDLPYTVKPNGGTKTEKTDDNTLKMMQSVVDMPNRDNVKWYENGTYQAGTDREFEAIHIYDLDKQVIAVFKKSTRKFVTTCQLTNKEDAELKATGNFGGGEGWFSGQVQNLPPQQGSVDTLQQGSVDKPQQGSVDTSHQTPVNTFESDITGITPIDKDNS